ncbi:hypothetical protein Bca52824_004465 [Brassica carinata]|uniref:VIN3-like C-terminal domain-containing protein n=1 Tax=Brassica carinata TaxID=52824 RepID=A0A8X7WQN0_BRACI|nr:hypothetical protein Bca52824_004465 [Brassica carinata]
MDEAVRKLEGEVGPLVSWERKMARGIVNRLPSGAQVQKLCSLAMEALDKMVSPLSESVSRQDESNNVRKSCSKENDGSDNIEHCSAGEVESELEDERLVVKRKVNEMVEGRDLLVTPCKREQGANAKRSKSRTTMANKKPETNEVGGDKDLGHIVKTIRCLEKEGHIDKSFRERFLTWYSLRATHREVKVVKVFVETFMDDLSSLGQQLVDTFSECMLSKGSSTTGGVPAGFCLKLWH